MADRMSRESALETVPSEDDGRLTLRVEGPNGVSMHPLPLRGEVTIGRAEDCGVQVDDRKLSRRHLTVRTGSGIEVVDAGSMNGTRVRGRKLAPGSSAKVLPGEAFEAGLCRFVVEGAPAHAAAVLPLAELDALATRLAGGDIPVLVLGETGVGKERLARAIHERSRRASGPFVPVHCGALAEPLLESELFGHERGAFTGAVATKIGLLEAASGGTVFLDEVGEMPPALQVKLLRVLEQREVTRVGAVTPVPLDVRVVSATNRDMDAEVARGRFRQDLFFRLRGAVLYVPPLRDRVDEIAPLATEFARGAGAELTQEALDALVRQAWPGNVRELRSVVERAALLAAGAPIERTHLMIGEAEADTEAPREAAPKPTSLKEQLKDEERRRILDALEASDGNQTKAAKLLGMPRRTLIERLRTYGYMRPRKD
jgi:DNA-binding NtrC family response regulator